MKSWLFHGRRTAAAFVFTCLLTGSAGGFIAYALGVVQLSLLYLRQRRRNLAVKEETGLEQCYVMKQNKRLRCGYTTGSCAAAAAKAAAMMLLLGQPVHQVDLMTPKGILLHLQILDIRMQDQKVTCAVRKDGGDDPDVTDKMLIYASVAFTKEPGIILDGGPGVGRVTQEGLEQPVGAAAINRVPRQMILDAVTSVCETMDYQNGLSVLIFVPGGEAKAKKTFNPRLGIEGGISILGTSGIVVPMSEEALIASIRLEMSVRKAQGAQYLLITPGNYGETYLKSRRKVDVSRSMKCSNYVGETIDMAAELGFRGILFVAHIGKFIKVSGGIMNTHSKHADCRAELIAAQAVRAGASLETAAKLLQTITSEEAVAILNQEHLTKAVMEVVLQQIQYYLQNRCGGALQTEVILYSNRHGFLGETKEAEKLLQRFPMKTEI